MDWIEDEVVTIVNRSSDSIAERRRQQATSKFSPTLYSETRFDHVVTGTGDGGLAGLRLLHIQL